MKSRLLFLVAAGAAIAVSAADTSAIETALSKAVLAGKPRTSFLVAMHEIEIADRAADGLWRAASTPAQLKELQRSMRRNMVAAIGGFPEKCPLDAKVLRKFPKDGYSIEEVLFQSYPGIHVPALLFLPDPAAFKPPYPGVIVTCGHSKNGKAYAGYQRTSLMLAKAGMVALLYDPFDQGERIQKEGLSGVHGHNAIGVCAALLGRSMAGMRIWDGMRAIDYLQSRPETDPSRIGVCGQSGGGTMTSLIMAIEPRIKCAAPSCYLSTMRDVYGEIGPQDAEQNIFGQLAFGLNHLGYVLMQAPNPVLMQFKTADFFPFQGALETAANAKTVAARFGWEDRFRHVYGIGPHGWSEGNRNATVDWMRMWLRREGGIDVSGESYRAKDCGFDLANADCGIPEEEVAVTPGGSVLNLSGERTAYDLFRDELKGIVATGKPSPETVKETAAVPDPEDAFACRTPVENEEIEGGTLERMAFVRRNSLALPAVLLSPAERKGPPVVAVADGGRAALAAKAAELFAAGIPVLALDISATGEIAASPHKFYGSASSDEEIAVMHYALGRSLAGERACEIAYAAKWLKERFGAKADIVADGRTCIAAHHARGAFPDLVGEIADSNAPLSWRDAIGQGEGAKCGFSCVVSGALRKYDWTDL